MAEQSKISWCDSTINPWEGCERISEGCRFCYAETRDKHWHGGQNWGPGGSRRKSKSAVKDALRLNAKPWVCDVCGIAMSIPHLHGDADGFNCRGGLNRDKWHRRRIFSLSLGDWLEGSPVKVVDGVPVGGIPVEWRAEMLDTIRRCPDVEWILCTKRPEAWHDRLVEVYTQRAFPGAQKFALDWLECERGQHYATPPKNITLLASVEDQATADERIPHLLRIPAARRGLSLEPLLGPVDVFSQGDPHAIQTPRGEILKGGIDWIIIGGESGPKARYCNQTWIRSLMAQAKSASVPVFIKQMGSHPCMSPTGVTGPEVCMYHFRYKDKKGADLSEWPEDLRVQQFPFVS
jgi:protein gp37